MEIYLFFLSDVLKNVETSNCLLVRRGIYSLLLHIFDLWSILYHDILLKCSLFLLAYFVAKKGEKNGMSIFPMPFCICAILNVSLYVCINPNLASLCMPECYDCYSCCCIYFTTMSGLCVDVGTHVATS